LRPRRPSPALLAGSTAILGIAAGVLIVAPWAGGQGEPECEPTQTVSERALVKLERLNRRLSALIEQEEDVRLSDFYGRVAELRQLKHDLIRDHFPPLFGLPPLQVFRELAGIDVELEVAQEFKGREGANAKGPLRIAKQHKEALEKLLRRAPCQAPRGE
jgi:hypothetical protein